MGVRFDYDFGTNEVLVHDAPKGSAVVVDGVKYVPERTCKMEWNGESGIHSMQNCSCCDEFFSDYCELPENFNFCPNCGAKVVK